MNRTTRLRTRTVAGLAAATLVLALAPAAHAYEGVDQVTAMHDFDGDGNADLLAITWTGALELHRGDGAGGWLDRTVIGSRGFGSFNDVHLAGDVNGDGHADILGQDFNGTVWLFRGSGTGGLTGRAISLGTLPVYHEMLVMDVDRDGVADVYGLDKGYDRLWLHRGTGGGEFDARLLVGTGVRTWDAITTPGDSDGDGSLELDVRKGTQYLNFELHPNGKLQHHSVGSRLKGTGFAAGAIVTSPGDFTGDGYADTFYKIHGDLYVFHGTASGGIGTSAKIGTGWRGVWIDGPFRWTW